MSTPIIIGIVVLLGGVIGVMLYSELKTQRGGTKKTGRTGKETKGRRSEKRHKREKEKAEAEATTERIRVP